MLVSYNYKLLFFHTWNGCSSTFSALDAYDPLFSIYAEPFFLKIRELDHQIEKNKDTLKALQDLDCKFRK